jgi:hypothetical protein
VATKVEMGSFQRTLAMALTLALGAAFMPLGCGGSDGGFSPGAPVQRDTQVPPGVAQALRTCTIEHKAHLGRSPHSVSFDVQLANNGQVDAVALRASTLADEDLEACMAHALRSLSEDDLLLRRAEHLPRGPVAPEARALLGQAGGALALCVADPPCLLALTIFAGAYIIGVQINVYVANHPGTRTHPAKPQLRPPTQPSKDPKPAGDPNTTGPTPPVPPQPPDCPRNESFTPKKTDNATGCIDKKGNLQCYASRHDPCAGVHTHGRLIYQEIRNGICKVVDKKAVRCEGPFKIAGPCGSVPTTGCMTGGPEISGIFED